MTRYDQHGFDWSKRLNRNEHIGYDWSYRLNRNEYVWVVKTMELESSKLVKAIDEKHVGVNLNTDEYFDTDLFPMI